MLYVKTPSRSEMVGRPIVGNRRRFRINQDGGLIDEHRGKTETGYLAMLCDILSEVQARKW